MRVDERPDRLDQPADGPHDVALLQLVCLVRAGDGYVVRAVGRFAGPGGGRSQVDISFGDAVDGARSGELAGAVRQVQRWCDEGTTVALVQTGGRLLLRGQDGTEVRLPRSA